MCIRDRCLVAGADDHWIAVTGTPTTPNATSSSYMPLGKRVAGVTPDTDNPANGAVDEDKYLRAVVYYLDMDNTAADAAADDVRKAIVVSANPVRKEVSSKNDGAGVINPENGSPGFSPSGTYTRTIPENSPKGTPLGLSLIHI